MSAERLPLVGLPACITEALPGRPQHSVQHKYLSAVRDAALCQPVIIPSMGARTDLEIMMDRLDGFLMTGSPSNVHPDHYGGLAPRESTLLDTGRDVTSLALIRRALAAGLPLFCICRGMQELNVALGGTLHQHLHELSGRMDHRENKAAPLEEQYGPRHDVLLKADGIIARIVGTDRLMVNSLHGQGIDHVAPGLEIEATALDGTIEAMSVTHAKSFAIAVQWHPEWMPDHDPASSALFRAFGDACRAHAEARPR
jgi:putative glutamine amidotransferase